MVELIKDSPLQSTDADGLGAGGGAALAAQLESPRCFPLDSHRQT